VLSFLRLVAIASFLDYSVVAGKGKLAAQKVKGFRCHAAELIVGALATWDPAMGGHK